MREARLAGLAAVVALALGSSACAGSSSSANDLSSKTPGQIVAAARAAAVAAATVHVAGSILVHGSPISLNMELVSDRGGTGRISVGSLAVQLVELDRLVYVKGNDRFDERIAGPVRGRRLRGKWLKGPARGGALRSFATLTSLPKLLDTTLGAHGTLTHTPGATVAGRSAIGVGDLTEGATLYVSATGIPYPLELVWNGARRGKLVFNGWNQPAEPAAPTQSINVNELQSRD